MNDYTLPAKVKNILDKFTKANYQIYIVGGAVRDLLLGKDVKDWDFTTDAKPEQILKLFPEGFYDNKFGTVGITVGNSIFEVTTMRKEGVYEDFRHPKEVSWTDKIEEDLARRDFTMNAVAIPYKGEMVDPFNGCKDIEQKIVRAVGDPNKRFEEDALRLMRAIRFSAQLNFDIENNTFEAIKKNSHLTQKVSWERIRDEFFKILGLANPYIGIIKLREAGILQIILPELERCFGLMQEGPKHTRVYDIGEHSLLSLKFCPSVDPITRLATLLHDIGKPDTFKDSEDGNVTFYGHDIVGGRLVQKVAQRFRLSRKESEKIHILVRFHMFTVTEKQTDSAIRRFIRNLGLENIDDMLSLRIGDRLGGGTQNAQSWRMKQFRERINQVLQKPFSISDLKINGNDVMGKLNIKPSKQVGEILQKLFEEVLEDSSKNNRDYLLNRANELI